MLIRRLRFTVHSSKFTVQSSLMHRIDASGIRRLEIPIKHVADGRTSAVASLMQPALGLRAFVAVKLPEWMQCRMAPDGFEIIIKNIAEFKFIIPEKQVTRKNPPVRHHGQLGGARRAPRALKRRKISHIRQESGAENPVHAGVCVFDICQTAVKRLKRKAVCQIRRT